MQVSAAVESGLKRSAQIERRSDRRTNAATNVRQRERGRRASARDSRRSRRSRQTSSKSDVHHYFVGNRSAMCDAQTTTAAILAYRLSVVELNGFSRHRHDSNITIVAADLYREIYDATNATQNGAS